MIATSAAQAQALVRDASHFQWFVIPLLLLVIHAYGEQLAAKRWSVVLGALAFKRIGYSATLPLSLWLIALAVVPIWDDLRLQWWLYRHGLTQQSAAQQGNPDEE